MLFFLYFEQALNIFSDSVKCLMLGGMKWSSQGLTDCGAAPWDPSRCALLPSGLCRLCVCSRAGNPVGVQTVLIALPDRNCVIRLPDQDYSSLAYWNRSEVAALTPKTEGKGTWSRA